MRFTFVDTGNVGTEPELTSVELANEQAQVCNFRCCFDRYAPDGEGGWQQRGQLWLDVAVWGDDAERVAEHIPKGARVCVLGRLLDDSYEDRDSGKNVPKVRVLANHVLPVLSRVERIEWRQPRRDAEDQ